MLAWTPLWCAGCASCRYRGQPRPQQLLEVCDCSDEVVRLVFVRCVTPKDEEIQPLPNPYHGLADGHGNILPNGKYRYFFGSISGYWLRYILSTTHSLITTKRIQHGLYLACRFLCNCYLFLVHIPGMFQPKVRNPYRLSYDCLLYTSPSPRD